MSIYNRCRSGVYLTALRSFAIAGICSLTLFTSPAWSFHVGIGDQANAGLPSVQGVQPVAYDGNPSCSAIMHDIPFLEELRIDDSENYESDIHPVDITLGDNNTFAWENFSLGNVIGIVSKGGPNGGNFYDYRNPNYSSDGGLHSPLNKRGRNGGLSHISFCYLPGDPDITVEKRCPAAPVLINGGVGGATYNYEVLVTNTGDGVLDGLTLSDSVANCSVAEDLAAISLGETESVTLHVSCDALAPLSESGRNKATVTADTQFGHEPTVSDMGDTNDVSAFNPIANCPENAPPPVAIDKACSDPMIRLVERTIGEEVILAVQACVDVTVTNLGDAGDETLVNVELTDSVAFDGVMDLPDLAPGDSWSTTDDGNHPICYYPSAPTGTTEVWANAETAYSVYTLRDGDLFIDALFSNTATVIAEGAFSSESVDDSDDADCSICKSLDTGLPAECPSPELNPIPLPG